MGESEHYTDITVLICTLNEGNNLPYVLPKIPQWVNEILVIDGHSTDNTVGVCKSIRPSIKILFQPGKGKGDAIRHGIKHATSDIIVTLDADGSTDPSEIERFVKPLLNGYDYVKGSRFRRNYPRNKPWYRILGNWIITITFNIFYLRWYTDLCSGYNAFRRSSLQSDNLWSSDGFENEPLINCWVTKKRLNIIEVGHSDQGRISGEIKELAWRQGFKAIKCILRERFHD